MAAIRSDWIPVVISKGKMTLAFSLLVCLLVGLPNKGNSAIPAIKPKAPSNQECRHHVEKALDQYFDTKEGDQTHPKDALPDIHSSLPKKQSTSTKIPSPVAPHTNVEKDKKHSTTPQKNHLEIINKVVSEREEKIIECDEEEEEKKEEKDNKNYSSSKKDEKKSHTFDDKKGPEDVLTGKQEPKIDARLAEDEEEEEEEIIDNEDVHQRDNDNRMNDGNISDNTRDSHDLVRESITRTEHRTTNIPKIKPRENVTTKVRSQTHEEEEKKKVADKESKIKDSEKEVESDKEEESLAEEEGEEESETDDDESRARISKLYPIRKPITTTKTQTRYSAKATGGSYSATIRMAQKLSGSKLPPEQPKAQEVSKEAQTLNKSTTEGTNQTQRGIEKIQSTKVTELEKKYELDDDLIENIYEDDYDDNYIPSGSSFRSRDHIDAILNLDEIGTGYDQEEDKHATNIYKEIKKIHANSIKPMEVLYKYTDSSSRLLGDAEIFNKPMILFLGPWSTGKTSIINYLLGIERTPEALKTGTGITDLDFTVITHGDKKQTVSGTELTVDWRFASLQRFGQGFLDHFKAVTMPHTLLKKITIVDTPGILENRKNLERGYPFNDAFQWFIDRADAIYVVLDPTKVDVGAEMGTIVDQLKGRDVRFILNKADSIRRSDLMRVVGQLFWNLSPLMGSTEAPIIYAVSLSSKPFNPTAPAKFLADQENNFLYDFKDTMNKRVENRILYARRHAVRVRNHAKMVDCYLATYYRHKSIFSNKKNVAKMIIDNPIQYQIYEGLGNLSNVSRYDILDTSVYKNFFQIHPLYDFRPLASTCSYFRGCPIDKLDKAINADLPELLAKYKKAKDSTQAAQIKKDGR